MPEAPVFFKHREVLVVAERLTPDDLAYEGFQGYARHHWARKSLYRVIESMGNRIARSELIVPDKQVKVTRLNNG